MLLFTECDFPIPRPFSGVTLPLLVGMVLVFALISLLPLGQSIPLAILVGVLQHSSCAQWARAENLRERLEDEIDAQIEACEASQ
jgi:MFS superfamily sulfate permease-like transporter